MTEKWQRWLPWCFVGVLALSRWPGLLPVNFSAVYALMFCAGVYFQGRLAWWLPFGTMLGTDLALNCYYQFGMGVEAFQAYQFVNYAAYAALILLGRCFRARDSWLKLLSGGLLGAVLFYLITNTAAWFFNPFGNLEYVKSIEGWLTALTKGTAGYQETWTFFRNTLLGGGLFTGLFVGAMKFSEAEAPEEQEEAETETQAEGAAPAQPADSKG